MPAKNFKLISMKVSPPTYSAKYWLCGLLVIRSECDAIFFQCQPKRSVYFASCVLWQWQGLSMNFKHKGSLLPWCMAKGGQSSVQGTMIFMSVLIKLPFFSWRQSFLFQYHELQKCSFILVYGNLSVLSWKNPGSHFICKKNAIIYWVTCFLHN